MEVRHPTGRPEAVEPIEGDRPPQRGGGVKGDPGTFCGAQPGQRGREQS